LIFLVPKKQDRPRNRQGSALVAIKVMRCDCLEEVTCFYRQAGYGGIVGEDDTMLGARAAGCLVGVVRLALENSSLVLRGMQVEAEFQRQSTGSKLLEAAVEVIGGRECWCIPYSHLSAFYAKGGFVEVPSSGAPGFLADRLERYRTSGRSVVVMRRPARSDQVGRAGAK
jgi:GNAT superfamily N-acetyltransferase